MQYNVAKMYVKSVKFTNLRCFKAGELDFRYPGDGEVLLDGVPNNVNVILGVNASGKTTVLKAIALALLAQLPSTGFVPDSLVRQYKTAREAKFAEVTLNIQANTEEISRLKARVTKHSQIEEISSEDTSQDLSFYEEVSVDYFLVAYGANRRAESGDFSLSTRRKSRSVRYDRIASIFEEHLALLPIQSWLYVATEQEERKTKRSIQRDGERYRFLDKLLPKDIQLLLIKSAQFLQNEVERQFTALPDGYRAYISWLVDLLYQMSSACPKNVKLAELQGVVMVDEIDSHVHPSWQKTIVSQIANAFPNLQFIFTTHSPIVAGSVSRQNLWITKIAPDGSSILERPHTEIYGLSADQILTSDIFGLESTRPEKFLKQMDALEQKAVRGDSKAALDLMRGMALGRGAIESEETPAWVIQPAKKSRKKS